MTRFLCAIAALGVCCACISMVEGQLQPAKQPPLVERVKKAIDKGVAYLKRTQLADGSWHVNNRGIQYNQGGSALAVLSLLEAGVPANDPVVQKGLEHIRGMHLKFTYTVALQTMALAKGGLPGDRIKIKENVDWLIKARVMQGPNLMGWGYTGQGGRTDNSNTQYALLGLLAGKDADIFIPENVWKSIRDYYVDNQVVTQNGVRSLGHWEYVRGSRTHADSHMTMTTAGICGLLIAGMEIKEGREKIINDGKVLNCGAYRDNVPLARALRWLNGNFRKEVRNRTYYNLYGIERAGRLSGLRFFGNHDWYREGCDWLVDAQHADGSFWGGGGYDRITIVSTSFALLFLSKGRTPILVSRIVHGVWPRKEADYDWNRDRYAVRNLTKYCSNNLFKKLPLGWQNFDVRRAITAKNDARTEDDKLQITSDLLQSPILFISGHESPADRFSDKEIEILQRFVENGGFIAAEACCGSPQFDRGIHSLVKKLFPDNELVDLPSKHPIWKSFYPVPPGSFKLKGLQMGCKTVMVYAPEDMSCRWEADYSEKTGPRGQLAFRMGANIIAYATGLEPPRPRLAATDLLQDTVAAPPRGYVKVAQIKYDGDWQPAPRAMRNLMNHMRNYAGLDTALKPETMRLHHKDITDYKFLYLHGRGDPKFDLLKEKNLEQLKFNLETGAVLLADACCGSAIFDKKFRRFLARLFPKQKLERVPLNDILFSKELSGVAMTKKNIRLREKRGGPMEHAAPWLEGIKIDGQWAILYSKYDIGCALERHQSSDCLGYDFDSAKKIAGAAVLYLLRP